MKSVLLSTRPKWCEKICHEIGKDEKDGLKALASIVGIDIQQDNVDESRLRLRSMFLDKFPNANSFCLYMLATILCNNIICADSLAKMQEWIDQNQPKQLSFLRSNYGKRKSERD